MFLCCPADRVQCYRSGICYSVRLRPDRLIVNMKNTHSWRGTSLSTMSRVFVFVPKNVVVHVEGVGFQPRAVVAEREVVAVCNAHF